MEENIMKRETSWRAKGGATEKEGKPVGRGQTVQRALMKAVAIAGAVLLIGSMVAPLGAQSYPNKPIRFIVPWPPGGPNDICARIAGPRLSERLGQPVVIDNRPGASGNIGVAMAAKARPDGYTIVIGAPGSLAITPIGKDPGYNAIRDFAPISLIGETANVLLMKTSLPFKSLKEFIDNARANPGKFTFGSAGTGAAGHLAGELFKILVKVDITHVPYKGVGPALIGLMAGEVDIGVLTIGAAVPQVQAGKVKGLAVLSKARVPSLPDLPTAKEAGIDNFEVSAWYGLLAPAGTPQGAINRLSAEWGKIEAMPDIKDQMRSAGIEPLSCTPEQFSQFIKSETVRWAKVIKEANIPKID
jgi:tripartite-type tricarboxylate transporter receptor subunit TctC